MIFTISDEKFFDNNYIKVIDGIAGAGKSSIIDRFFKDNGKIYGRYTSTNVLKRDAQKRYPDTNIETVASGLFKTDAEHRIFYNEPKDVEYDNIVIDEILQTSPKVIDYCYEMIGKKNFIITTDTKQMLAPECGEKLLTKFLEMQNDPRVIWITLTESKRPVNKYTADIYKDAYSSATELSDSLFKKYSKTLNKGSYFNYTFTKDDIILPHTKDIEDFIFRDIDPRAKNFELIPKGSIGRNVPKNLDNYPVASQKDAEEHNLRRYLQPKNICTVTRFVGSEIKPGIRGFFVVEDISRVLNREFYTLLTRFKDINDLTILTIDLPDTDELRTFCRKPVKVHGYLSIDKELPEIDKNLKNGTLKPEILEEIVKSHKNDKVSYDTNMIFYKGKKIYSKESELKSSTKREYTPSSIMKKDEKMHYSYTAQIYRILEKNGIDQITYPNLIRRGHKEKYQWELDLYSAYPSIMSQELVPTDGFITYQKGQPGKLDFYVYRKADGIIGEGTLFTQILEEAIPDGEYLFSIPAERGCKAGAFLFDKAHRSVESKSTLKEFHWGYYQKKFLTPVYNGSEVEYYELNENFIYEIMMVSILTVLCKIVYTLSKDRDCTTVVDAVHFNEESDIERLKELMSGRFPNYEFRVIDKDGHTFWKPVSEEKFWVVEDTDPTGKHIVYKNYPDLKTEKDIRREAKRLSEAKARAEGRRGDNRPNSKYRKKEAQV